MPVSNGSMMDLPSEYVKVKAHYGGDMLISDLDLAMTYTEVCEEVRTMCGVRKERPITLKWIDDEVFMLLLYNRFLSLLESIYRRGARRWRKLYRVNGHLFQAKRFNRKAYCGHCSERIWGLGRQGYKCINCKLLVHKRCHKLVPLTCQRHMDPVMPSQEPLVDHDKSGEEVELPPEDPEETDAISFLAHNRKVEKAEDDAEDLKAVVDGIEGIQISQGLGLGDFDLIRVIGRGSYAKVLLVRLKKNEQIYAMKVVKKDSHYISHIHVSCSSFRLFLVIEYVNGGDLMFHMQKQRKLPEEHSRCVQIKKLNYLFDSFNMVVILEKPIRIPRSLSVKAASVLKGFLNKDPKERLGCQVQTGFTDIKSHTFFRSIDWDQLEQKQVTPPFKPQITDDYGLDNFDTQFTNEPVQLTPDDEDVIKRIDQSEFEGFDYINPLLLSNEETI
uniref:protein kinase C n=1 Tax=Sinocyclocheilus grahami TaxID=75366 RepID=A0A672KRA9_SINGR